MKEGSDRSRTQPPAGDDDFEFLKILKGALRVTRQVIWTACSEEYAVTPQGSALLQ